MTADDLIAHLKRERAFLVETWPRLSGMPLSEILRARLAGYDQAIADAEAAILNHARGDCVLCPQTGTQA